MTGRCGRAPPPPRWPGTWRVLIGFAVVWEIAGAHPTPGRAAGAGVLEAIVTRRWPPGQGRSLGMLLAAIVGAAAGLAPVLHARPWLPALQLTPVIVVVGDRVA